MTQIGVHMVASFAVTTLVLAACGPAASRAPKANNPDTRGGDLIMAWHAANEPASLDGHVEPYQPAWLIDSLIADPLLILGPDGEFHPALATEWGSSPS